MSDEDKDVDIESDEDDIGLPSPGSSSGSFGKNSGQYSNQSYFQADKRAHHNALERKRRDHIKDSFSGLRDAVPALHGEKVGKVGQYTSSALNLLKDKPVKGMPENKKEFRKKIDSFPDSSQAKSASRAQILKKAAEYIQFMRRKNTSHQQDIDDLKRQNKILEEQIRALEKAKTTGNFAAASVLEASNHINSRRDAISAFNGVSESESSDLEDDDDEEDEPQNCRKKLKTSPGATPVRT